MVRKFPSHENPDKNMDRYIYSASLSLHKCIVNTLMLFIDSPITKETTLENTGFSLTSTNLQF